MKGFHERQRMEIDEDRADSLRESRKTGLGTEVFSLGQDERRLFLSSVHSIGGRLRVSELAGKTATSACSSAMFQVTG